MINFRALRYKNILATGNAFTEIRLDGAPTTLLTGRNGSGKSTMIEAITFALYNKAYRDITKPALVNTINNKALLVEIEFGIGVKQYLVRRGIKPAVFEIFINGEQYQSQPGLDDQKFLEEVVLQMTYKTFVQTVIVGNATYTPFMQLKTPERRSFVESLLDIRIFSLMTEVLKRKVSDSKQRLKDLDAELSVLTQKIDVQKSYIRTLQEDRERKVTEARDKIAESQRLIDDALAGVESLTTQRDAILNNAASVGDHETLLAKLEKLKPFQYKLKDNMKRLTEEIKFFGEHDDCPVCKQSIDAEFKSEAVYAREKKHFEVEQGFLTLEQQIKDISDRIGDISSYHQSAAKLDRDIGYMQAKVSIEQKVIARLSADIEAEQSRNVNLDEEKAKLKGLAKDAIAATEAKNTETEAKFYLDLQALLLKDNGVKAKVIKQYVPIINKLVNKYLTDLDFFANFTLDENFDETIRSRNRDELTYFSYSEGEKLKIDLSIMFTWITIAKLKNTVATNLLIFDEVTDAGLDNVSSHLIADILREFGKTTHVFVISHHPELYADKFERHLQFEKVNNYSLMKENKSV